MDKKITLHKLYSMSRTQLIEFKKTVPLEDEFIHFAIDWILRS